MYDWAYKDLFWEDSVHKDLYIQVLELTDQEGNPFVLTNSEIYEETLSLDQSIDSGGTIMLGTITSSMLRFETSCRNNLLGFTIAAYMKLTKGDIETDLLPLGVYVIAECNWDNDKQKRSIVAYDYMYDIMNTDVTDWYQSYWASKGREGNDVTWETFMKDFFDLFGIKIANKGFAPFNYYTFEMDATQLSSVYGSDNGFATLTVITYSDSARTQEISRVEISGDPAGDPVTIDANLKIEPYDTGYSTTWGWKIVATTGNLYHYSYPVEKGSTTNISIYVGQTSTNNDWSSDTALDGYFDFSNGNYGIKPNNISVYKTVSEQHRITGYGVLQSMLEIGGMFGFMNRFGEFTMVRPSGVDSTASENLTGPLYPGAPRAATTTTPKEIGTFPRYTDWTESGNNYRHYTQPNGPMPTIADITPDRFESVEFADYDCEPNDAAIVLDEKGGYAETYYGYDRNGKPVFESTMSNPFYVTNNWVAYLHDDLHQSLNVQNIFVAAHNCQYRPMSIKMMGNPCLEPGDRITVYYPGNSFGREPEIFNTLLLDRTLSGIQTLWDSVVANGSRYFGYPGNGNSLENRLENIERQLASSIGGGGGIKILSVDQLPANPEFNTIYLIQGEVVVV